MISYKDKTFCASPQCKNECGRQLTDNIKKEANKADMLISMAYFCGEPELISIVTNHKLISK